MERNEVKEQLEKYRETGVAYLSNEDKDMDFSKVDDPNQAVSLNPFNNG